MKVSIISPCSRPSNLDKLKQSIQPFDLDWYIIFDSEKIERTFEEPWIHTYNIKGGVSGNLQRNFGLDLVKEGWVYFLDDDNLLHPNLLPRIFDLENQLVKGYLFSQDLGTWVRTVNPNTVKVTHIDQAQFILKRDLIGELKYVQDYCADGIFIEELYKNKSNELQILPDVLCFYNRLRW